MAAKKSKKPVKKPASKKPAAKKAAAAKPAAKKHAAPKAASKPAAVAKSKLQAIPSGIDKILTPLDNRIVISVEKAANLTPGGIYIPDSAVDRPSQGRVVAKGRGRRNKKGQLRPLDVQVGDSVMFSTYTGTKVVVGGEELLILREDEVLGIVT